METRYKRCYDCKEYKPLSNYIIIIPEISLAYSCCNSCLPKREKWQIKQSAGAFVKYVKVAKGNHRHHWNYNIKHMADIIELSKADHHTVHRYIYLDHDLMMFRVNECDTLLDTKEKHIEFISQYVTLPEQRRVFKNTTGKKILWPLPAVQISMEL